ncbi:MAG: PorP/SprF family type IX secretion system membrane protein [Bacteroidota bacterium]
MSRIFAVIFLLFLTTNQVKAQEPGFSMFYAAPLYLNPAMAGAETSISLGTNYRTQWRSLDFPYNASQFSFIYPLITNVANRKHIGGLGLSAYNEQAGVNNSLRTVGVLISAAYNVDLDISALNRISFGLQGGYVQKSINFNDLTWGSQYDPFLGFQSDVQPAFLTELEDQRAYPVFNAGVMWLLNPNRILNGSSAYGGFSISNLNQPNESLVTDEDFALPFLYKVQGGLELFVSPRFAISPNGLFLYQNSAYQVNLGAYFKYTISNEDEFPTQLQLGAWHRLNDSFILSSGLSVKSFVLGFSFDYTSSTLRFQNRGQGAYEFSLTYRIRKSKELKTFSTPLI